MAKEFEDKFFEELRSGVVEAEPIKGTLDERKRILERNIAELEANVIKDPKAIENLKKELASVNKQIKKEEAEKAVESGEVTGKVAEEKTALDSEEVEQEQEQQEKQQGDKKDKEDVVSEESAKQAYYDAMMALHQKRIQTLNRQRSKVPMELVSSDEEYRQELKLEAELYRARDQYMKFGNGDPYAEKRTELIKLEKIAREPMEMQLRNDARKFSDIETQLRELDKREEEINKELLSEDITEGQINKLNDELAEMGETRKKLELSRAGIKERLDAAMDTRRTRVVQRAGLERQFVDSLSKEDMKNYKYQQAKISTMNRNFDAATKQHYENIKLRIEEREEKIKKITKELSQVSDTDFERRLLLLNELDKENSMLEADREAKSDLDRGITLDTQAMKHEVYEKSDAENYRQEEFDKATQGVRETIEQQKHRIGEGVVADPTIANVVDHDRENTLKAAAIAIAYDSPEPGPDTLSQDIGQAVVAKCVIDGLEDKVRDPNNPEDAQAIVAHDEQLREADNTLDNIEKDLTE